MNCTADGSREGIFLLFVLYYLLISFRSVVAMVGVVQRLEHWTVAPGVGGSNPLAHPINAPVAQLDRASASGAEGRRFESSQARQTDFVKRNLS